MNDIAKGKISKNEIYDESVCRPMKLKFAYIMNLIGEAMQLKNDVKKLKNHPMNTQWLEIQLAVASEIYFGFEQMYANEIFEFCDDFKRTRNQNLKVQIGQIRKLTEEILDGNYEYDQSC